FWTLVIGIAVLAFFPGSDVGDPVAVLQIQPTTAPDAAAPESDSATEAPAPPGAAEPAPPAEAKGQMDLPPGFGVPSQGPQAPIVEAPPGMLPVVPPQPAAPDDAAPPDDSGQQGAAPSAAGTQQAALEAPAAAPPPPPPPTIPDSETGAITLPPAPVAELVEESQYGPLPRVATDGRRPIDVYARPSRYVVAKAGDQPRVAILGTGLGLPDKPGGDALHD